MEFNPGDKDLTTNVRVNLALSDEATELWDHMEERAYDIVVQSQLIRISDARIQIPSDWRYCRERERDRTRLLER